jgi:hypothetical protein
MRSQEEVEKLIRELESQIATAGRMAEEATQQEVKNGHLRFQKADKDRLEVLQWVLGGKRPGHM